MVTRTTNLFDSESEEYQRRLDRVGELSDEHVFNLGWGSDVAKPPSPTTYGAFGGGLPLFYDTGVTWLFGSFGSGKSWLAQAAAVDYARADHEVLYVDFEDSAENVTARVTALGATLGERLKIRYTDGHGWDPDDLAVYIHMNRRPFKECEVKKWPDSPDLWRDQHTATCDQHTATCGYAEGKDCYSDGYSLVIVDGCIAAMQHAGFDGLHAGSCAEWINRYLRHTMAALVVDHVNKTGPDDLPVGSTTKMNLSTAAWKVATTTPFGAGRSGTIQIRNRKDKPGYLDGIEPRMAVSIDFHSDASTGAVSLTAVDSPSAASVDRWHDTWEKLHVAGHRAETTADGQPMSASKLLVIAKSAGRGWRTADRVRQLDQWQNYCASRVYADGVTEGVSV